MPDAHKLTIAVTGASGYLAGRLIEHLDGDDRIERILGFDLREPETASKKLVFDQLDIRNEYLAQRLAGVDVVVHLAFIMDPIKDESRMRDVNVAGSQNVFRSSAEAGVKKIVYTSSATVYGAHPDNDFPLTEESPLRANLDFSYPAHKLEVEYVIKEFRQEFPDITMTVFRPAIVFGSHVDNAWSHMLELPVAFGVRGHDPPLQFVHEEDVARALHHAVGATLDGPFNLAPADHIGVDEMLAIIGRKRISLAEPSAYGMAEKLWSAGLGEAPAGMLHYLMHPWVVSPAKLVATGFRCERSSTDAFAETATASRPYVRIGRSRVRKDMARRGALAGLMLGGAAVGLKAVRSRSD